ncbi:unnamed protein product [Urochloa decumbens]|uniref:Protein kinase domain-containing protein n=1 Tax=Urochloa decumbens TaxID=240449 RepID=A0ABC9AMI5_9POAL
MAAIEQNPRITTAWSLMLLLSLASAGVLLQAFAQLDGNGFISIDCGLPGTVSYVDEETSLSYAPDAAFTDTGSNHDISDDYITPELSRIHRNVRSFPDGKRNCYTLRSLMAGSKYLVRATFKYGDYDRLSRPPIFDLYVGVNFMSEVNISDPDAVVILEAVVVVVDDVVQVCLVNTGTGTPFISGLELRPLKDSLYPQANATQGLLLLGRRNFGPTNKSDMVSQPKDPTPGYIAILHFAELQLLPANTLREFYINLNGKPWYSKPYSPTYLYTDTVYNTDTSRGPGRTKDIEDGYSDFGGRPAPAIGGFTRRYDISINATANSTLPPTINAIEVFSVVPTTNIGTDSKDRSKSNNTVKPQNELTGNGYGHSSLHLENRRFTYRKLEMITDGFQRVLGRGGFGYVYSGFLEDGTQVAVKLRSHSSNQGVKEFLAETHILTRIHHKNLVSMVGYCKDGEYMALVYEYMAEGTLQEHIAGSDHDERCLTWRQRLRIALESAQGLEYLHKGCNPPLIHRDVKATNILLNEKLEAKIADFGLSRAFGHNSDTHISTNTLVGTPGYVDPEYQATMQPAIKSDVCSFGVVLLELITGKPAILRDPEPTSIIQWARQRLARGDIEGVVDARLPSDDHNVNGVWKVADVALKCTAIASVQRPTMTDVVMQLQECLELEEGRASGNTTEGFVYTGSSGNLRLHYNHALLADLSAEVSQKNDGFPVDHNFGMLAAMMSTGPATR